MEEQPEARLVVRRPELAGPVLERVVAALAARVDLPIDRVSDAQIASAALAVAASRELADEPLRVEFVSEPGSVTVRLGPLPAGAATRVVEGTAVPGFGAIVERLVDRWSVDRAEGGERLSLAIAGGAGVRPS
ncbi:MAG TPA: hypothetical protein VHK00_06205 [Miltoncostaeaceae bacterium]|nr:hypothetical protein [Miltoncostaeaceae bacterium]